MAQTKEERTQYGIAYRRDHVRQIKFDLSIEHDADILAFLDSLPNRTGYLKALIRADIEKGERKTMTYKIKPEYAGLWGEDVNEDTIITESDLEMIARGWEKTPYELMDQLIPQEPRQISLDNGHTYLDADEAIQVLKKHSEETGTPFEKLWEDVAYRMDDDIRETVHMELAPCTEEKFLRRYLELSPCDLTIG